MNSHRPHLLVLACVLTASPLSAAAADPATADGAATSPASSPTAPDAGGGDHDPRYLIGSWSCTGELDDGHGAHRAVGMWRVDSRQGGRVLRESFQQHTDHGVVFRAWGYIRYDGKDGRARRLSVNSWLGGSYTTSIGWQDDTAVWQGWARSAWAPNARPALRETVTRSGADHIALTIEVGDPAAGGASTFYTGTCERQPLPTAAAGGATAGGSDPTDASAGPADDAPDGDDLPPAPTTPAATPAG